MTLTITKFSNNIFRYPILGAVYLGPSEGKPSTAALLYYLQKELRQLGKIPIQWTDDLGDSHTSHVYMTLVQSDAMGKCEMMHIIGPNGEFSCPYCKYRGVNVNEDDFPEVFDTKKNKFKRTGKKRKEPEAEKGNEEETDEDGQPKKKKPKSIGTRYEKSNKLASLDYQHYFKCSPLHFHDYLKI